MYKAILKFVVKAILAPLPVIAPFLAFYIWCNPFEDLSGHSPFLMSSNQVQVGLNKGMITVRNYEIQKERGHRYNAFIFGSSISCYYDTDHWVNLLKQQTSDSDFRPYHFDSSSESLEQMADKIEYIDKSGDTLKYALIVLDPIIMSHDTDDSPMSINPPQFTPGLIHRFKFHYIFFRASTNSDFFKSWVPGKLNGTPYFIGRKPIFETQPIVYNPLNNQESIPQWELMISQNVKNFYDKHPLIPSPDSIKIGPSILTRAKIDAMERVANIFKQHNTNYQIIIGPNRRKQALNPEDLILLNGIFGSARVNDFSISRANDLANDTLLYDNIHYRSLYADSLMNAVYR